MMNKDQRLFSLSCRVRECENLIDALIEYENSLTPSQKHASDKINAAVDLISEAQKKILEVFSKISK